MKDYIQNQYTIIKNIYPYISQLFTQVLHARVIILSRSILKDKFEIRTL